MAEANWLRSRWAEDRLRNHFLLHGYQVLSPPILEYTELFLRKSGGQLASRMYTLTDPGGNLVSMRPEFTCSIMRHLVEVDDWAVPYRLQYCGPVFRYEEGERGLRQFTQVGAELLGAGGPMADAEGLGLAKGALSALGSTATQLTLGDIAVHRVLLEACGLSERAINFVLGALQDLVHSPDGSERTWAQADKLGLLTTEDDGSGQLPTLLREMDGPHARRLLKGMLELAGTEEGAVGQRTSDEVVERLLRKAQAADDPVHLRRGMEAAGTLAAVKGQPSEALANARALLREYGAPANQLDNLARSLELLENTDSGPGTVKLDFGLARELAYYTGIIFEVTDDDGTSLGGGGRYDGLARALGSPYELPAFGFAYSLEAVLETMPFPGSYDDVGTDTTYIWPTGDLAYRKALGLASDLRGKGQPAIVEVFPRDLPEALAFAQSQGYSSVLAVDADGTTTTHPAG